ncbi:MAG: hypothetical protein IJW36_03005 [Clostridia bacterium]|nr:hypothetical protein [Clostridia bacterium]
MADICTNTQPITLNEFFERLRKKVHQMKNYFSLYITPHGDILDCGYPDNLGHNAFCKKVYTNLDSLSEKLFNSHLRGLGISFKELPYYLEDYFKLLDIQYENLDLYWTIHKVLLGSEDVICQDMGFVKVAINIELKTFEVVVPNGIFGKAVTGAQQDTINSLSDYFCLDLKSRLKSARKENAALATKIQRILNKINQAYFM